MYTSVCRNSNGKASLSVKREMKTPFKDESKSPTAKAALTKVAALYMAFSLLESVL
jgi:hypothetical protein